MRYILVIILFIPLNVFAQDVTRKINISPVKVVTVQLPANHKINEIRPGLESDFYSFQVVKDNIFIIQATGTQGFPDSNLTIFCDSAIFYVDIRHSNEITKYHYQLEGSNAVKISPSRTRTTTNTIPTIQEQVSGSGQNVSNDLDKIDTLYFSNDRLSLGIQKNNVLAYVNNLAGSDEYVTISLKITNQSPVTFHSDLIQWFILTKRKKSATSIGDDDDPIQYRQMNYFVPSVQPEETALFIMRFHKFSLDKNNSLKLVIGEGQGRRNLTFELPSRLFYKSIEYSEN